MAGKRRFTKLFTIDPQSAGRRTASCKVDTHSYSLTYSLTHSPTHSPTHLLTHSPTHSLTHLPRYEQRHHAAAQDLQPPVPVPQRLDDRRRPHSVLGQVWATWSHTSQVDARRSPHPYVQPNDPVHDYLGEILWIQRIQAPATRYSLTHSLTHLLTHLLTHSLTLTHSKMVVHLRTSARSACTCSTIRTRLTSSSCCQREQVGWGWTWPRPIPL